jgi:hypothetical protein
MKEVEEQVTDYNQIDKEQQDTANASDNEELDNAFDEPLFPQQTSSTMTSNFDSSSYTDSSPIHHIYPQPVSINTNIYGMLLDLTGSQSNCMDTQSMYTPSSQSSFPSFSPQFISNDAALAFFDPSSSSLLPQNLNFYDQVLLTGPVYIDDSFYQ